MNVHIQHPPEAEVQIHQVARVQPGQRPVITEGAHSVQQRSQPGSVHESAAEQGSRHSHTSHTVHTSHTSNNGHNDHDLVRPHYPHSENVGRCFQETVDGQVIVLLSFSFRLFPLQAPASLVLSPGLRSPFKKKKSSSNSFVVFCFF